MNLGAQPKAKSSEQSGFGHVAVLLEHLRLTWLLHHFPAQLVWSAYVCVNGFVSIALWLACPIFCTSWIVSVTQLLKYLDSCRMGGGELEIATRFPALHPPRD